MIGDSKEEGVADDRASLGVSAAQARRAIRMFPILAELNVVRSWAAMRVMSPDGFPIYDARSIPYRQTLARWRAGHDFLDALYLLARSFRIADPDVIACRCEDVTGAALHAVAAQGATGPNQAKAFLRCGMGPCQGRLCGLTVVETLAASRGVTPDAIGPLHIRNPVKPVTLAEVASLASTDAELAAVERH